MATSVSHTNVSTTIHNSSYNKIGNAQSIPQISVVEQALKSIAPALFCDIKIKRIVRIKRDSLRDVLDAMNKSINQFSVIHTIDIDLIKPCLFTQLFGSDYIYLYIDESDTVFLTDNNKFLSDADTTTQRC